MTEFLNCLYLTVKILGTTISTVSSIIQLKGKKKDSSESRQANDESGSESNKDS